MTGRSSLGWMRGLFMIIVAAFVGCRDQDPGQHKPAAASDTVTVAERKRVEDFWRDFREATQLRLDGNFEAAREGYERALEKNPEHEDALYYLGNVYLELGNWEDARAQWQRLVKVNPSSSRGFSQLGSLALCRPDIPAFDLAVARTALERAHELNPEETGPVLRLGQLSLLEGDPVRAAGYFDSVTGSNRSNVEAYYLKAYSEWLNGRGDRGVSELNRILTEVEGIPEPPVPGEGDTKTGRVLGVGDEAGCSVFSAFFDSMNTAPRPLTQTVLAHFRDLRDVIG